MYPPAEIFIIKKEVSSSHVKYRKKRKLVQKLKIDKKCYGRPYHSRKIPYRAAFLGAFGSCFAFQSASVHY